MLRSATLGIPCTTEYQCHIYSKLSSFFPLFNMHAHSCASSPNTRRSVLAHSLFQYRIVLFFCPQTFSSCAFFVRLKRMRLHLCCWPNFVPISWKNASHWQAELKHAMNRKVNENRHSSRIYISLKQLCDLHAKWCEITLPINIEQILDQIIGRRIKDNTATSKCFFRLKRPILFAPIDTKACINLFISGSSCVGLSA